MPGTCSVKKTGGKLICDYLGKKMNVILRTRRDTANAVPVALVPRFDKKSINTANCQTANDDEKCDWFDDKQSFNVNIIDIGFFIHVFPIVHESSHSIHEMFAWLLVWRADDVHIVCTNLLDRAHA